MKLQSRVAFACHIRIQILIPFTYRSLSIAPHAELHEPSRPSTLLPSNRLRTGSGRNPDLPVDVLMGVRRWQQLAPIPILVPMHGQAPPPILGKPLPFPSRRETRLLPGHDPAGVHGIERQQRDQHHRAIKHILIRLVARNRALQALAVLGQPEKNAGRHQQEHEIQDVD